MQSLYPTALANWAKQILSEHVYYLKIPKENRQTNSNMVSLQ